MHIYLNAHVHTADSIPGHTRMRKDTYTGHVHIIISDLHATHTHVYRTCKCTHIRLIRDTYTHTHIHTADRIPGHATFNTL